MSSKSNASLSSIEQQLVAWNDTFRNYPLHKCLHHLFEEQVTQTPDNIALIWPDISLDDPNSEPKTGQLTYQALNERANQLAHYLQANGVGPEVLVGVFMERSLEMVISLYAILKAGGAYVPLDPEYPAERVEFQHFALCDCGM
ncbi:MAG: AMP-binding protein [Chloroflexota bacterium]